jgi:hypothetical protein
MRRTGLAVLMLLGLIVVSTAHADEWLIAGAAVAKEQPVEVVGILKLTDLTPPLGGEVRVECNSTIKGTVGPGAADKFTKWASLHRDELEADWQRAKDGGSPEPIDPLP